MCFWYQLTQVFLDIGSLNMMLFFIFIIRKGMWAVKLCSNEIIQFLTTSVQHLSKMMLFLSFFISPGSAEALVMWGGKLKYLFITYFLSNICTKNYQNWFMYVRVTVRQSSDILWHSVDRQLCLKHLVLNYTDFTFCGVLCYDYVYDSNSWRLN